MNKVILIGRLCQKPERREINDKTLIIFTLAVGHINPYKQL